MATRLTADLSTDVILSGVVGSVAYGMDHPHSDEDALGVCALPTARMLASHAPRWEDLSQVTHEPDVTLHEALKFVRLALSANPTVLDLLWLPQDCYRTVTEEGRALLDIREKFLSQKVRHTFLNVARQYAQKARNNERARAKSARHTLRVLDQGLALYRTGFLPVRLADPQHYLDFGQSVAEGDLLLLDEALVRAEQEFEVGGSPLPEKPDVARVNEWLMDLRRSRL